MCCVALEYPYKVINVILVLSKTKGREILDCFFFFLTLAMVFFHDFVGFFFTLYSVCLRSWFFDAAYKMFICERLF